MASQYLRLLEPQALSASKEQPREQVAGLGAYKELNVIVRVLKLGTGTDAGNKIYLEHAATNEEGAFIAIDSASWVTHSTADAISYLQITGFSRYVRWVSGDQVAGGPVALIDVVAKE